jgi:hypothetical protein
MVVMVFVPVQSGVSLAGPVSLVSLGKTKGTARATIRQQVMQQMQMMPDLFMRLCIADVPRSAKRLVQNPP